MSESHVSGSQRSGSKRYVVEVHDVSTADPGTARRLLDCVPPPAAACAALLVVPAWGGRSAEARASQLQRPLGCDVGTHVLHGYTHTLGRSLLNAIWFGTENEAEFARLDEGEAERRLTLAVDVFRRELGETPRWFCAPRWQLSPAARRAVRGAGLGVLERDGIVTPRGVTIRAPVIWFDDGARLAARLIGGLQRAHRLARALRTSRVIRVALHPRDLSSSTARRAMRALMARMEGDGWVPCSLDDAAAHA